MKAAQVENNILVVQEREDEKLNGRKGALVKVLGHGIVRFGYRKIKRTSV